MIHKLRRPFEGLDGKQISAVTARDYLTGGDVLAARREGASDDVLFSMVLVARVCGLDLREVESMDVRDIRAIQDHIGKLQDSDDPKG